MDTNTLVRLRNAYFAARDELQHKGTSKARVRAFSRSKRALLVATDQGTVTGALDFIRSATAKRTKYSSDGKRVVELRASAKGMRTPSMPSGGRVITNNVGRGKTSR